MYKLYHTAKNVHCNKKEKVKILVRSEMEERGGEEEGGGRTGGRMIRRRKAEREGRDNRMGNRTIISCGSYLPLLHLELAEKKYP